MSQEISKKVLWIFVFLILAAIAVLGVLFIHGYQTGKKVTAVVENSPTPNQSSEPQAVQLILTDPATDVATSSARITLNGKTGPNNVVAVVGGSDDALLTSQADGNFSTTVALNEGVNMLTITAYNENGEQSTVKRNIVYTKNI